MNYYLAWIWQILKLVFCLRLCSIAKRFLYGHWPWYISHAHIVGHTHTNALQATTTTTKWKRTRCWPPVIAEQQQWNDNLVVARGSANFCLCILCKLHRSNIVFPSAIAINRVCICVCVCWCVCDAQPKHNFCAIALVHDAEREQKVEYKIQGGNY